MVNVPLMAQRNFIGLFCIDADRPNAFSEEHVKIASEVANSLAVAIQQSYLNEQIQRHATESAERNVVLQREIGERQRLLLVLGAILKLTKHTVLLRYNPAAWWCHWEQTACTNNGKYNAHTAANLF